MITSHLVQGANTTGAWQNVPAMSPGSTLSPYRSLRAPTHAARARWPNLIQTLLHSKQSLKHLFVRDFQSIFITRCSPVLHPYGDIFGTAKIQFSLRLRVRRQVSWLGACMNKSAFRGDERKTWQNLVLLIQKTLSSSRGSEEGRFTFNMIISC